MSSPSHRYIRLSDFVAWRKFVTGKWYANPVTGQIFRTDRGTEIAFQLSHAGYLQTEIQYAGMRMTVLKHRVIWIAAHGMPPHDVSLTIDHINGDKTDNRIENLQMITLDENLWKGCRKLRPEQAREIRKRYAAGDISIEALAKEYHVSREVARLIIRGVTYREVKDDDTE